MATAPRRRKECPIEYPTGDEEPMGESDIHRENMTDLIETLGDYFANEPMVCVSGWLLVYYEEGDPRKRVAPDVFVVRGVEADQSLGRSVFGFSCYTWLGGPYA